MSRYQGDACRCSRARRRGRRALRSAALLGWACALLTASGCSPVTFAAQQRQAQRKVAAAEGAQAERYAPYELVLARVYLDKAREESAEAHYAEALRLLAGSSQAAERARLLAQARIEARGPAREHDDEARGPAREHDDARAVAREQDDAEAAR